MKYWVYKDARILGPFDKDAFAGLPGVDAATLVSAGDCAASGEGGWLPAGEIEGLAGVALASGPSWPQGEPPSTYDLLDKLQIEVSGLIGDDDFPGACEDLFQDAEQKKNFADLLNPRPVAAEAELRRSKDRVSELTVQLEMLYKRVSELESSQTDLMHLLAEKEAALRLQPQPSSAAPISAAAPSAPAPTPARPEAVAPPVQEPPAAGPPQEWPSPTPPEAVAPKKAAYPKVMHFKVAPTIKSFRLASSGEEPIESKPAVESAAPAAPETVAAASVMPAPVPAPVIAPPPAPEPISLQPVVPPPAPVPPPVFPAPVPQAASAAAPMPVVEDMAAPPATMNFAWGGQPEASSAPPPSTQEVLARLSKPAPAPQMAPLRPVRSNKPFLIAGAALVALLGVIGYFMLHQPKDLKQMVSLDDSRERLGALPAEDATRIPLVKPKVAETPAPAPAPVAPPAAQGSSGSQPAAQGELDSAVTLVKDFPLDGGRGTVAQWLQYSYNASPDAGKETWSASATGDRGYLVEYRFVPTAQGGADMHYLFAVDMSMGLVFGKNLDAQRMLAGSAPRVTEEKPKAKAKPKAPRAAPKRAAKRSVVPEAPKEVPLMPLPNEGELKPPAEDDGAFGTDTINNGL